MLNSAHNFQYEVLVDANARFHSRPELLIPKTCYGRLLRILGVTLSPSLITNSATPVTVMFGIIHTLNITREHRRVDVHFSPAGSRAFGATEVADLACIQCVVGLVPDRKEIAVIDRSGALARALFVSDA